MNDEDDKKSWYPPAPKKFMGMDLPIRKKEESNLPQPITNRPWFHDPDDRNSRQLFDALNNSMEVRVRHGIEWDKAKEKFVVKDLKLIESFTGAQEWRKNALREFLKTNGGKK